MTELRMVPLPDYGDLLTMEQWKRDVRDNSLIPYDGSGHWSTSEAMDQESDVWSGDDPPGWATHVMWFNK